MTASAETSVPLNRVRFDPLVLRREWDRVALARLLAGELADVLPPTTPEGEAFRNLVDSIREEGVISPPSGEWQPDDTFLITSGHTRTLAAIYGAVERGRPLGEVQLPVHPHPPKSIADRTAERLAENMQRTAPALGDQAEWLHMMMVLMEIELLAGAPYAGEQRTLDDLLTLREEWEGRLAAESRLPDPAHRKPLRCYVAWEAVEERLNISTTTRRRLLNVLRLPREVQAALPSDVTHGHIDLLCRLEGTAQQLALVEAIRSGRLDAAAAGEWARREGWLPPASPTAPEAEASEEGAQLVSLVPATSPQATRGSSGTSPASRWLARGRAWMEESGRLSLDDLLPAERTELEQLRDDLLSWFADNDLINLEE